MNAHAPNFWSTRGPALVLACTALAALTPAAMAVVDQSQIDAAERLFAGKKFADAAGAYAHLADELGPGQAPLAPKLAFNRGCAQLAAGDAAGAEASFLQADAAATDPGVRAAARYNLGQIVAEQAALLAEKQPEQAIEAYRRAERHFRNALTDRPQNADAAHNVEVVQRAIAKLQEQQKQEQQKQDQQKKDDQKQQDKQDQKDKQQKDEQQKKDQGKQSDKPDQQKKQDQGHKGDQRDQQKQQDQDQSKGDKQDRQNKPDQQQKQQQNKSDGKDQQQDSQDRQDNQQQAQKANPGEQREFDRTAAQILDKERQQRERLKQWLRIMRSRAAPVEKDW